MALTSQIPREKTIDNSLAMLMDGYEFIHKRRQQFQSDIFQTRLMGQKVICMGGEEAARMFYDNERFQRKGAVPKPVQKTLFGENVIQTMDGDAHKHRKLLFMSLMTPERLKIFTDLVTEHWQAMLTKWEHMEEVVVYKEAQELLFRSACEWAGVPVAEKEIREKASNFAEMVDAFGSALGPRHRRGKKARLREEKWMQRIIEKVRAGKLDAPEDTATYQMAWHRDLNGNHLDSLTAGKELINVIRPIVAIDRYVTFGALAMHEHPESRRKIRNDEDNYTQLFVQEVRRFYPFAPFLGARVSRDFLWNGYQFKMGTLVLLDIYGTTHDPNLWESPDAFWPERFKGWDGNPFDLVPQGGGDHYRDHRCAGEWLTIDVLRTTFDFFSKQIDYDVPDQDLSISKSRMPTLPASGFIIKNVQRRKK